MGSESQENVNRGQTKTQATLSRSTICIHENWQLSYPCNQLELEPELAEPAARSSKRGRRDICSVADSPPSHPRFSVRPLAFSTPDNNVALMPHRATPYLRRKPFG